jgi:hypothetical protein
LFWTESPKSATNNVMQCDRCGSEFDLWLISRGRVTSAKKCEGCRRLREPREPKPRKPPKKRPPTYLSWHCMKQRCLNPNNLNFYNYGGRGIRVCERWLTFSNFLADMGERPEGTSLDRIDVDGDYAPQNCRWVTQKQQTNNMRKTFWVTYKGERLSLQMLSDRLGIDRYTLRRRILDMKWPEEYWAEKPSKGRRAHLR